MNIIETEGLTKSFGDFTVVNQLNLQVPAGEIFGFLGPNGSGKSTTMRMLCGILRPSSGQARVLGYDIPKQSRHIRSKIGYMSQKFSLYEDLTVAENLSFYARIYGVWGPGGQRRREEVLEITGLRGREKQLAQHLSGGWKQRLGLACALLHDPQLIFLDEPTAGIDPVARRELWNLLFSLASAGKTLFVSTHYMDEAERCSQIGYIYLSQLMVCGTPNQIRADYGQTEAGYQRVEITGEPIMQAFNLLHQREGVIDLTFFGQSLHGLIQADLPLETLKTELEQQAIGQVEIRSIRASLEDIFLELTRKAEKQQHHVA